MTYCRVVSATSSAQLAQLENPTTASEPQLAHARSEHEALIEDAIEDWGSTIEQEAAGEAHDDVSNT